MKRRILSLLIMAALLLSFLPAAPAVQAAANKETIVPGGSSGRFGVVLFITCDCPNGGSFETVSSELTITEGTLDEYNRMDVSVSCAYEFRCTVCSYVCSISDSFTYTCNFCAGKGDAYNVKTLGGIYQPRLFVRNYAIHKWQNNGDGTHICSACQTSERCTPGYAATCATALPCEACGKGALTDPSEHEGIAFDPGVPATCTAAGTGESYYCRGCQKRFSDMAATQEIAAPAVLPALGHSMQHNLAKAPTCDVDGSVENYYCGTCGKYFADAAGTKELADSDRIIPAAGHAYVDTVYAPGCLRDGYTKHTCLLCGYSYKDTIVPGWPHYFGLWYANKDDTHSALCLKGCGLVGNADCDYYTVTNSEGELVEICPVCGTMDGKSMAVIQSAAWAVPGSGTYTSVPRQGESVVYGAPASGDCLMILSVAYEYSGIIQEFQGDVRVRVALKDLPEDFRVVRVDVTEGSSRTEEWTEVEWTYKNGVLYIDTDSAGIFLILPAEE